MVQDLKIIFENRILFFLDIIKYSNISKKNWKNKILNLIIYFSNEIRKEIKEKLIENVILIGMFGSRFENYF